MTSPESRMPKEELEIRLALLSRQISEAGLSDGAEVLRLAEAFQDWILRVRQVFESRTAPLERQASQLVQGLRAGRPASQGLERLRRVLEDCRIKITEGKGPDPTVPPEKEKPSQALPAPDAPSEVGFLPISEDDAASLRDFLQEGPEHLAAIEKHLLDIRQGKSNEGLPVFRAFHTLKGIFGFLGFQAVSELAHQAEVFLEPYKSGQGRLTSHQNSLLLKTADFIRDQIQLIAEGLPKGKIRLLSTGEMVRAYGAKEEAEIPAPKAENSAEREEPEDAKEDAFLRVPVPKMNLLLEAVEELTLWQGRVAGHLKESVLPPGLLREIQGFPALNRQLQELVLSLRLVQARPLFSRVTRLAKEVARQTGKKVQIHHQGDETELDKGLADQLFEPLLHLVRNAIDHGLELPAEREALGKPPEGNLTLSARQEGVEFVLEVEDDGKGLHLGKIQEKGRALGLLGDGEEDPEKITDLIFAPGFSTSGKVSQISGRGVGLDLVKRRIQSFRGSIRLENREGKGCKFILRFPLTVALADGVLVRSGEGLYLVLVNHVERLWTFPEPMAILQHAQEKQISFEDRRMPLLDLAGYFGEAFRPQRKPVALQLKSSRFPFCLLVDEVLGKRQVVLKDFGGGFNAIPGIQGGAFLGEGEVALILDVEALASSWTGTAPAPAGSEG